MKIWVVMGTTWYTQIIHQTRNAEKFVSIIEFPFAKIKSLSQSSDEFESFYKNLEVTLNRVMQNTPYLIFLLSCFNAKCTNWYKHDKTNFKGIAIENISSVLPGYK